MRRCFFAVWILVAASTNAANANCRLPEPDGGEAHPNPPNLHGRIDKVSGNEVFVQQDKTKRTVRVLLPENSDIYTAFGGDGKVGDLAPGQTAWVWFQECKWPKAGTPISAYFRIYSKDPNDRH